MSIENNTNAVENFLSQIEDKILERDNCLDEKRKSNFLYDLWKENFYKRFLYDELNIVGGAFSVLEKVSNESLLLFSKDSNHSKDVKNSDFFWFPYEVKYKDKDKAIAKTIDTLFLTTRKSQKLNRNPPDFLKYLEIGLDYEFNDLTCNQIFNKKGVLYCDASEILIILLCYFIALNKYNNCNSGSLDWPPNSIESISTTDSIDTIKEIYYEIDNNGNLDFMKLYTSLGLLEKGSKTNLFDSICERIQQCIKKETTIENLQENINEILTVVFKIQEYDEYDKCIKILHEAARFPILPYIELYTKLDEKITGLSHLVFPVWQSFAFVPEFTFKNKPQKSFNVVFALLTVKEKKADKNYEDYFKDLYKTINKLGSIVADMVFYNSFANKSITHQAIKSAQTKIISRNFSHHIGSHVMPNVSLKQINERYKELCNSQIDIEYMDDLKTRLDTYITERNEFLCGQDTSFRSVLFFSQIIVRFLENILILDNLCRSEGLGFRKNRGCDVEIHVKINGNSIKTKYNEQIYPDIPYNGLFERDYDGNFSTIPAKIIGKDIPIAVPNIHVVFSILENFIRNTAKHQKKEFAIDASTNCLKDNLIVTLDIKDDINNKNSYWFNISDNKSIVDIDFPDKLGSQIIDINNEIAQSNLGIIDFKICAGLLNNKSFEEVDEDIFRINRSENGELSYDFKVLKPKNICLIGYSSEDSTLHPSFDYYKTVPDFLMAEISSLPYQFYIIKEAVLIELLDKHEKISGLPFRLLVEKKNNSDRDFVEYFQSKKFGRRYLLTLPINLKNSEGDILKQCWERWLTRWGNNKKELVLFSTKVTWVE